MDNGHFYYIKDVFYNSLPNCGLMTNKMANSSGLHNRPCHYCFDYDGYYWMIPISSKVSKYRNIYNNKMSRYGKCDTIRFGYVNGQERAFLIQNAFPVTLKYIDSKYMINNGTLPATVNKKTEKELNARMRSVIRLYNKGINITLVDISTIISFLSTH